MSILIDTANLDEITTAGEWGWVRGVTTNPTLMAMNPLPTRNILVAIGELIAGPIFFQPHSQDQAAFLRERKLAHELLRERLVLKIPATQEGFKTAARMAREVPCCITAVYSPSQALIAREIGADYAVVYYSRMLRMLPEADENLQQIIKIFAGSDTRLLGASFHSVDEVQAAIAAGIRHFTLPFTVLRQLPQHDLSDFAVQSFTKDGKGLDD